LKGEFQTFENFHARIMMPFQATDHPTTLNA
jgi:hypothetical protein